MKKVRIIPENGDKIASNFEKKFDHEGIYLSKIITEKLPVQLTFIDGEVFTDYLRWHTSRSLGMQGGRIVNKQALKYWEVNSYST